MYAYIKGILTYKIYPVCIVEAGGVGYKILTSANSIGKMPDVGKETIVYTYLNVKEDLMELYGFYTKEELSTFELLISVSGVGPKAAISILSSLTPETFAAAVINSDVKAVTKAQGVGPKLASRIILELKDKISKESYADAETESLTATNEISDEAVEALMVLGYSMAEAKKAVLGLSGSVEEIINQALKNLMRR